ncbi:exosortase K [uncultured Dokdonia sp.]|uniref:exosortase K n=1 Tax=uncultured Dokdonia sp. TaxID=575653 RepID=UPI00262D63E9|nr:exosortase K [uncultured Dokdonia sp.]
MISNKNIPYYIIAFILFIVLKVGYRYATVEDLDFLLNPTHKIISLVTGLQSTYAHDSGYYYEQLNIVIDKSCAGYNFWLLSFLMFIFLLLKHTTTNFQKINVLWISIIGAYLLTIGVNSARIFTSISIQRQDISILQIDPSITHQAIGISTNLTFLVLTYLLIERVLTHKKSDAKLT